MLRLQLNSLINTVTAGNLCALARTLGINQQTLQSWLRNNSIPQTDLLLKICYEIKISLLDFLTDEDVLHLPEWNVLILPELIHIGGTASCPSKEDVKLELENALKETPPPAVSDVASRFGYKSECLLRRWFPELCKKLTAARKAVIGRVVLPYSERSRGNNEAKLRQALELALNEQEPPSLKMVVKNFGYKNIGTVKRRFPDLCERISKRYREYKMKCKLEIRSKLIEMLNENPPPSLGDAAKRLGYASSTSLRRKFADLCSELVGRQQQYREHRIEEIRRELEVAATEEPPLSLRKVAKRLGYNVAGLLKRYPKECKVITRRHGKFMKKQSKNQ